MYFQFFVVAKVFLGLIKIVTDVSKQCYNMMMYTFQVQFFISFSYYFNGKNIEKYLFLNFRDHFFLPRRLEEQRS